MDLPTLSAHAILTGFPDRPAFDVGVSDAVLQRVGRGELPTTMRLFRPGRMLAFGRRDVAQPGFAAAAAAAAAHGFGVVERLSGGRAAVFTPGTLAISLAVGSDDPQAGTTARYELLSGIVLEALRRVGVADAGIGEVPGEYCPGAFSVHAGGRTKLAGIAQRVLATAAHVGGVVVVEDVDAIRAVLVDVYAALELPFDPATVGGVASEVGNVGPEDVRDALVEVAAERLDLSAAEFDEATLALAADLEPDHAPEHPSPAADASSDDPPSTDGPATDPEDHP